MKYKSQLISSAFISLVFAVVILVSKEQLGSHLREQVLTRRAEVLHAISLVHQVSMIEAYGDLSIENPADQLVIMEEISELSGADGFRLFSPEANYIYSFPETITEGKIRDYQLNKLKLLIPEASLNEGVDIANWIIVPEADIDNERISILEIVLPLHIAGENELLGIVQLILDGDDVLDDVYELESRINKQSIFLFISGLALIAIVQIIAFRFLNRSRIRLAKRTEALNRANRALALSNKTTAIGSIALHLVHGLRNSLSSVKSHLESLPASETGSRAAKSAVDRMATMIENVVMTLRENEGDILYQITMRELLHIFEDRFLHVATRHNVTLKTESHDQSELDNREASLILLIIENIACNAIEACGDKGEISLSAPSNGVIRISDNGPGIQKHLEGKLFQAGNSTKEKGSGLGLAISKQLSISIGADLYLVETGKNGTTFELRLASAKGGSADSVKDSR